jgi:hypothetical protein
MGASSGLQHLADVLRSASLACVGLGAFAILAPFASAALGIYVVPKHNYPWVGILQFVIGPGVAGYALALVLDRLARRRR